MSVCQIDDGAGSRFRSQVWYWLVCWWYVSDGFEEPAVVEPVHILGGGVLDLVEVAPWSPLSDEFCLVQADDRFG